MKRQEVPGAGMSVERLQLAVEADRSHFGKQLEIFHEVKD